MNKEYDIIVVGGGHAGIEASLAAARMGFKTLLLTMDRASIGRMSCNPAIGGQAKGHLVRELDALGAEMAKLIDKSGIHFKMLNKSKGPAVWSPRAQADKYLYEKNAQDICSQTNNLDIIDGIAREVLVDEGELKGIRVANESFFCRKLILTCGTFLNGKIHIGLKNYQSGRSGEPAALGLTESLLRLGFKTGRLKTGTPPRVDYDSVDWDRVERQEADEPAEAFSFQTESISNKQIDMFITYTNEKTHDWLRTGLEESPIYRGEIDGVGPRYCPSIEDKIVRFSERDRHQLFLEREAYDTNEVYVNGFSTSLPEEAQVNAIRSVQGLEKAKILKLGYAIEYDYFEPYQLNHAMETKLLKGLYFAGQICGTSGYEEAAAQGFIAGVNAALSLQGKALFKLERSESYIGVLIDDLINKSTKEPYRMFTSSAEFRLLLRQDNADIRLMKYGHRLGLISDELLEAMEKKKTSIAKAIEDLKVRKVKKEEFEQIKPKQVTSILHSESAYSLLKRPEIKLETLLRLDAKLIDPNLSEKIKEQVEFEVKYEGYLKRQAEQVAKFQKNETKKIPQEFDYSCVKSLSNEGREKLMQHRPNSIGQASRISGVRPSDINVLMVHLQKINVPRGTTTV